MPGSFEELVRTWDGEFVVSAFDAPSGAWIFIAIHDRTLGMALGGCRLSIYPSPADGLRDAMRLSKGMTFKWAAIDFPFGGGKSVLAAAKPLSAKAREDLLLRLGDMIQSLNGLYGVGVDLGTTPDDMSVIGKRTRWVFGRPSDNGRGDPGPFTAMGVHAGLRAACKHAFGTPSISGATILVQGVGGVGRPLARRLAADGARLLLSDAMPDRASALAAELDARVIAPERVYGTECDIFAPCAIGGVLNERSVEQLRCRIAAGSANNQLEKDSDAELLHRRGILYAPDFVINAGGAIAHGSMEVLGWTEAQATARVERIFDTLDEILGEAANADESPLLEAVRRADRNLRHGRAARQNGDASPPA
jgi:leucine dehydrogenase